MNKKIISFLVILPLSMLGLAGCSTQSGAVPTTSTIDASEKVIYSAVIDVRTLEEWNAGHLENAIFASVEAPNFEEEIQKLDKTANYFVYCRSGNRAGTAIEIMKSLGFTGVITNGGALENAADATGLQIILN